MSEAINLKSDVADVVAETASETAQTQAATDLQTTPTSDANETSKQSGAKINWLAPAGFFVSFMSYSIGILNLRWGIGLLMAIIGLVISIRSFWVRGKGREWAVGGIILSTLFLIFTIILWIILKMPFFSFIGL